MAVKFVKLTELLLTVLVNQVMLKLKVNVSFVLTTVLPVPITQTIVLLVFLQELIQTFVHAQLDTMML